MTLYQFNALDETEQLEAIWEKGVKLADRQEAEFLYILYQIDKFYVEEKIHQEHKIRHGFKSFASTSASFLQPYLDKIDITGL
jgi:hypothetical protein